MKDYRVIVDKNKIDLLSEQTGKTLKELSLEIGHSSNFLMKYKNGHETTMAKSDYLLILKMYDVDVELKEKENTYNVINKNTKENKHIKNDLDFTITSEAMFNSSEKKLYQIIYLAVKDALND